MKKKLLAISAGALTTLAHSAAIVYDTTNPMEIVGTVTNKELIQEHLQYLKNHPEVADDSKLWLASESYIPSYVRFTKMKPNPFYIKPKTESDPVSLTQLQSYPTYKMLPLPTGPLDQGQFGTCVTFSAIGALISASNWTNYDIQPSPSCLLNFMVSDSQGTANPWEGTTIYRVLSTIWKAGIIKTSIGNSGFCNSNYPIYQPYGSWSQSGQGLTISFNTYNSQITWPKSQARQINGGTNGSVALNLIKQQLNDGYGAYPAFSFNEASTLVNTYLNGLQYAAWIDTGAPSIGYHAIYVYGYDDYLCINSQCGVLYLRNSWGNQPNTTNGNYLMTYQYFNNHFDNSNTIMSFSKIW